MPLATAKTLTQQSSIAHNQDQVPGNLNRRVMGVQKHVFINDTFWEQRWFVAEKGFLFWLF